MWQLPICWWWIMVTEIHIKLFLLWFFNVLQNWISFGKSSKIAQILGGNKRKILLKACLENEFWISYFITKPSKLLLYTIYSIYQKAQLFKKSISHKFQIIPEPVLKNTQLVTEEISEDMASAKEELDQAVPFHTLLDVSGNFDLNQ